MMLKFEIRRASDDAVDSAYKTLAHMKDALDELDRPAGKFYGIDTETQKRYLSFGADTAKMRAKNPAPLALALTPKQYHDAKLRAIANEYGIELSEAREMYDTEGGRAENAAEWVKLVLDAANRGAELSRLTLDKFFELRPSAKLPESAIPNGYQRPEARKAERQRNPATKLPAKTADVRGAARRYMDFTGHAPGVVGEVNIKIPKAVAVIGSCDGILYTTVRDGKTERYIHEFKKADAPTFTVTPDGKGIFLIGGRYDFTERGIVDASDPTSPRKRRR